MDLICGICGSNDVYGPSESFEESKDVDVEWEIECEKCHYYICGEMKKGFTVEKTAEIFNSGG